MLFDLQNPTDSLRFSPCYITQSQIVTGRKSCFGITLSRHGNIANFCLNVHSFESVDLSPFELSLCVTDAYNGKCGTVLNRFEPRALKKRYRHAKVERVPGLKRLSRFGNRLHVCGN